MREDAKPEQGSKLTNTIQLSGFPKAVHCLLLNSFSSYLCYYCSIAFVVALNISAFSDTPHDILLARAGLQPLSRRRHIEQAVFAFRFVSGCSLPRHIQLLSHWLSAKPPAACRLRNADSIRLARPKKNVLKASPLYISLSIWNNLSSDAESSKSPRGLRSLLCRSI